MRCSDFSDLPSASLVSASGPPTGGTCSLRSRAAHLPTGSARSGSPLDQHGNFGWRLMEISQVPGLPSHTCQAQRPRWARRPMTWGRRGAAFRAFDHVGHHNNLFSRLQLGPHAPCVRFTTAVARRSATLGSDPASPFGRAGLLPAGQLVGFDVYFIFLLPRLGLAHVG